MKFAALDRVQKTSFVDAPCLLSGYMQRENIGTVEVRRKTLFRTLRTIGITHGGCTHRHLKGGGYRGYPRRQSLDEIKDQRCTAAQMFSHSSWIEHHGSIPFSVVAGATEFRRI